MNGRPKQLRNGTWGALVQGRPEQGDLVTVTTRNGKSWDAYVTRVVWRGTDDDGHELAIVATRRLRDSGGSCCDVCGSTANLMMASFGTACPNHYDDLS